MFRLCKPSSHRILALTTDSMLDWSISVDGNASSASSHHLDNMRCIVFQTCPTFNRGRDKNLRQHTTCVSNFRELKNYIFWLTIFNISLRNVVSHIGQLLHWHTWNVLTSAHEMMFLLSRTFSEITKSSIADMNISKTQAVYTWLFRWLWHLWWYNRVFTSENAVLDWEIYSRYKHMRLLFWKMILAEAFCRLEMWTVDDQRFLAVITDEE
jgi:hypothetical protein